MLHEENSLAELQFRFIAVRSDDEGEEAFDEPVGPPLPSWPDECRTLVEPQYFLTVRHVLDMFTIDASSAATAFVVCKMFYPLLKLWVDARTGRKLKVKVGDIEVEATQMKKEDVLRILELLPEKADRKKIRELLISASQKNPKNS